MQWINQYKGSSAQYKIGNRAFVSTFEGPSFADSWASVRSQTGGLYLVPDWSSLGPSGVQQQLGKIDGACEHPPSLPVGHGGLTVHSFVGCLGTVQYPRAQDH